MSAELSVSCVLPGVEGRSGQPGPPPSSVALQSLSMFFLGFLEKQTQENWLAVDQSGATKGPSSQ